MGRCERRPHELRLPTILALATIYGLRTLNRSAAIHNHSQDSLQLFVKLLVLSFSTSRNAPRSPARTFGEFIKNARFKKVLRQVDVAKAVGLDEITMGRWEKAERLPRRYSKVQRVCEILGLDYAGAADRFGPAPCDEAGFGVTLRWARVKKGLTQEQAARIAGIDPGTLARWERSNYEPPLWMRSKLDKLYLLLGVDTVHQAPTTGKQPRSY